MQYRKFGKLDWKVSALGFGTMRLPSFDNRAASTNVDVEEAERIIRHAIDRGVNYIDTAYPYGDSEPVLGRILKDGYREKVRLVTKSPHWNIEKESDFEDILNKQLERLQTDHLDIYLLHALNLKAWGNKYLKFNLLEKAERAIRDGKIGCLGFSCHENTEDFKALVDAYDKWAVCMIQYNYMDTKNQAGAEGLMYAAERGLGVVVMEPLLGGRLATPPDSVREFIEGHEPRRSPVDWALQWLWNQPEISVVISGMSDMAQVEANLEYADRSGVGSLSDADLGFMDQLEKKYRERALIPCTKCSYCMPCPNGVNIPVVFGAYNDIDLHDNFNSAKNTYLYFIRNEEKASACTGCGECEEHCPQKITISEWMPKIHDRFTS